MMQEVQSRSHEEKFDTARGEIKRVLSHVHDLVKREAANDPDNKNLARSRAAARYKICSRQCRLSQARRALSGSSSSS